MAVIIDPDQDRVQDGMMYDIPSHLQGRCQDMHASAVVINRCGLLLTGPSGSGKSFLQRSLRRHAQDAGLYSALLSDDYVRLVRGPSATEEEAHTEPCQERGRVPPPLLAFAPRPTARLQEVRGLGLLRDDESRPLGCAVMHVLVDLVDPDTMVRLPDAASLQRQILGYPIARLAIPQKSALVGRDLIFAWLSTWKG